MKTDIIKVYSDGRGREQALKEAEKFALYMGLDQKAAMMVRLLAEETMGLVTAITEDFTADFWLENTKRGGCRIHLAAKTKMNYMKRKELVAVSTRGRNEVPGGFMGKIRGMIEESLYSMDELGDLTLQKGTGPLMYASLGLGDIDSMTTNSMIYTWSLERYRANIDGVREENSEAREAWDELEKSIVANIADDVKVSVSGSKVELIIYKKSFG